MTVMAILAVSILAILLGVAAWDELRDRRRL